MKIRNIITIVLIIFGLQTVSCNLKNPCWDKTEGYIKNRDGRGEIEVVDGEGMDTAILWITHDRSRCGKSSIQGVVEVETSGKWYSIKEDNDSNPLILVYIDELESDDEQFGWIDCRNISFNLEDSYFEDDEQEQKNLAQRCETVDID